MKEVKVGNKYTALVDDEDYEKVSLVNWTYHLGYARWRNWKNKTEKIWMHHLILPRKDGYVIDHINGNKLDNRKQNLRYATYSQNSMNRNKANSNNTIGIRGINLRRNGRYRARLMVDNKCVFDRTFEKLEDAIATYNEVSKEKHGVFH